VPNRKGSDGTDTCFPKKALSVGPDLPLDQLTYRARLLPLGKQIVDTKWKTLTQGQHEALNYRQRPRYRVRVRDGQHIAPSTLPELFARMKVE
jgi:hypothetical protein